MHSIIGANSILGPLASDTNNKSLLIKKSHDDSPVGSPNMALKEPVLILVPTEVALGISSSCCDDKSTTSSATSLDGLPKDNYDMNDDDANKAYQKQLSHPPLWSPNEFYLLQDKLPTSWSLYFLDQNVRAASTLDEADGKGGDDDSLWFRLSRNDNLQNAVYLQGRDEILFSLDGILANGRNKARLFYVHCSDSSVVRVAARQVRAFLLRIFKDDHDDDTHKQYSSTCSSDSHSNCNVATLVHQQPPAPHTSDDPNGMSVSLFRDPCVSVPVPAHNKIVPSFNYGGDARDDCYGHDDDDRDDKPSKTEPSLSSSAMEVIAESFMAGASALY